jgi:hypothetical protein
MKTYPIISPVTAANHPLVVLLSKVGLFDAADSANQVELEPAAYVSEERLASYDRGIEDALSQILMTGDPDVVAQGDVETAIAELRLLAEQVSKLQATIKVAAPRGDVFMFQPK